MTQARIHELIYKAPFPKIVADTLIFVFQKGAAPKDWIVKISEFGRVAISRRQQELLEHPSLVFEYFEDETLMDFVKAVASHRRAKQLGELCDSTSGYGGKSKLIHESRQIEREIPTLKGDSIGRYELRKLYWFDFRKDNITGRTTDISKLGAIPKVLVRKTGDRIIATIDHSGVFPEQSLYFLFNKRTDEDLEYLLGLLNSRLLTAYYRAKAITNKKSIAQVKKIDLDQLPIRSIDFKDGADKARHDRLVRLVERALDLHKQFASAKTAHAKTNLQRQIDGTDAQIDQLVYELYELTPDEIKIVKAAT